MKNKIKIQEIELFLSESNKIEGVHDADSLKQAKLAWKYLSKQKSLTIPVILKTHKILAKNSKLQLWEIGYFRTVPVWVGGREGIKWEKILFAIESWIEDVKTSIKIPGKDGKHIKLDHITYEKIHPFIDFNGRTGRLFMNWTRAQAGLPILIIHADTQEHWDYYKWFKEKI